MSKKLKFLIMTSFFLGATWAFSQGSAAALPNGLYAVIDTGLGPVTIELYPDSAPLTVASFVGLAEGKFLGTGKPYFDGLLFHRVEPGFVVQTGDPKGNGTGGPGYKFPDEIDPKLSYDEAGVVGMANAGPGTNGSQFFITLAPATRLDGSYTIFGRVVKGLEVVKAIRKGESMRSVKIIRVGQKAQAFGMTRAQFDVATQPKSSAAQIEDARKRYTSLIASPSGIYYQILKAGSGQKPAAKTKVSVHYTLTSVEGKVLDSSSGRAPLQFTLGAGEMIRGFDMSVTEMSYGEKRVIVLPPELAYGAAGAGGVILPNAVIVFELELLAP